mmetsp:Transcript_113455/g.321073  ORF Transcript_113455/g.321073 Transcript_113455/m.321073 type:complete len:262 (+) Transcript_113455:253-1038(+)
MFPPRPALTDATRQLPFKAGSAEDLHNGLSLTSLLRISRRWPVADGRRCFYLPVAVLAAPLWPCCGVASPGDAAGRGEPFDARQQGWNRGSGTRHLYQLTSQPLVWMRRGIPLDDDCAGNAGANALLQDLPDAHFWGSRRLNGRAYRAAPRGADIGTGARGINVLHDRLYLVATRRDPSDPVAADAAGRRAVLPLEVIRTIHCGGHDLPVEPPFVERPVLGRRPRTELRAHVVTDCKHLGRRRCEVHQARPHMAAELERLG